MVLPTSGSISISDINSCARFTNGNMGINTTSPNYNLDINGTLKATTITAGNILATTSISSGAVNATNSTVTNAVSTNASSGTLNLSTGLTAGTILATTSISSGEINATNSSVNNLYSLNSTLSNLRSTLSSIGTLRTDLGVMTEALMTKASISTSLTVPNLLVTTSVSSGAVYATNSTVTNSVVTSSTVTNVIATNMSSGTLNLSTGLTAGTILATTSISSGEINATNSTVTNLYSLNSTLSNLRSTLSSIGTLRTDLGVMTEALMTKASISTSLTVPNLLVTTSISSGAVYATNSTVTNFVATSITAGPTVVTSNANTALAMTVNNPNSGSSAYSGVTLVTDQVGNFNIFKNSTTRTADGGVNTVTMRNDGGPLRLQSNTGLGIWVGSTGNVGINTTTPTVLLEVYDASSSIIRASGTVAGQQGFNISDTASRWSIYKPGNTTDLRFYDGADRVTFANGGNVGIGTISPTEKLNVSGNTDLFGTVRIGASSSSAAFQINLGTTGVGSYRSAILYGDGTNIVFSNQQNGHINFATNNIGNRLVIGADGRVGIGINTPANNGLQINSGELQLGPNNSNAIHIYASGGACEFYSGSWGNGTVLGRWNLTGLGVGTFSPGVALHVKGNVNNVNQPLWLQNYEAASGVYWKIGPDNGGNNMTVYNHNNLGVWIGNGGNGWNATSDIRVKKDLETLTSGLDLIEQLRPVKYRYNQDDAEKSLRIGFIAQEVRDLIPEIVGSNPTEDFPDGLLGLSLESFVPFLVNAIKDLSTELKQTKSDLVQRIQALENANV